VWFVCTHTHTHTSPSKVMAVNSSTLRWAGHVARMGRQGMYTEILMEKLRKTTTWKTEKEMEE